MDDTTSTDSSTLPTGIAIVGLAGRFPGAENVDAFWQNLLAAKETITTWQRGELAPGESADDPDYIPRRGVIEHAEWLDAEFFGLSKMEAEVTDPQQRVFLEVAWIALEHAGYDARRLPGTCGVWAGTGNNQYFQKQLAPNAALLEAAGAEAVMIGNEKDYIATRIAYRLNLRGPAINVVTACSTSLVAVAQAAQALMTYQCDMALAGGASIRWPQNRGYQYEEGSIFSPDGHCRAFDERSAGTVFSSGAGCVVLKRVEDALRDKDTIYAVIKSAALNNDGAGKVSFTAPGVDGQAENITMAMALADVEPRGIDYVEAHGTGTALGDLIEVTALTQAFRAAGDDRVAACGLGSLKTATGHMDAAAGVGGLIKTALALHHGVMPPTLHFTKPNPKLALESSPFRVTAEAVPLPPKDGPHRALIAALGVGGTNAHVVVEAARGVGFQPTHRGSGTPAAESSGDTPVASSSASFQPTRFTESLPRGLEGHTTLLLSARSETALAAMKDQLAAFLEAHPETNLHDAAHTLAQGRSVFAHRAAVAASSVPEAVEKLRAPATAPHSALRAPHSAFLFPGQGSQHARMGAELAAHCPVFREELERCRAILGHDPLAGTDEELAQTSRAQPALFVLSYALARQYEAWGIHAAAFLGHSIGEYVAATLAGVFQLEDALRLVAARGQAMQAQPPGVMLAVRCAEKDLELPASLDLAAVNGPQACVVSGSAEAIDSYAQACEARGIGATRLRTSHAYHSRLMDGALEEFRRAFAGITLSAPTRRVISNATGADLTAEQATSPEYWLQHLRNTVRFADGIAALQHDHVLLEVGPSNVLTQLARQSGAHALASLPPAKAGGAGEALSAHAAIGALWTHGAEVDWESLIPAGSGRRIALPTYPFERKRFCAELPAGASEATATPPAHQAVRPEPVDQSPQPEKEASVSETRGLEGHTTVSRREHLVREVQAQLLKISGIDVSAQPATAAFLDLGFDSLFLTQAGMALKKHFGVKITFRQLMEELTSADALAGYLDGQLPAGQFAPVAREADGPNMPHTPHTPPATDPSLAERLNRIESTLAKLTGEPFSAEPPPSHAAPYVSVRVKEQKGSDGKKIAFGPFKPVEKARDGSLTEQQKTHLAQLIADYCAKYPKSKQFTADNRPHFADPRAVGGFNPLWKEMVFPAVANRSEGAHLWDIDGNEWIDVVHGFGSGFFGHRPAFVVEALKAQLDKGYEIGPTHPLAGEVARMIRDFSGQERVAFSNTGSESLMAAIRVARTVTGRDTIVMFAGAYHGIFDEVLARPLVVNGELRSIPIAPGIPESAQAHLLVLEYGHPESLEIIERLGSEIAAVLVEPVPSRRPDIAPVEFVQKLRAITAASETALIFDEVVLGWRTCPEGAQKLFGIDADLVAYGKVVGGGMPLGVLAGKRRFMDALDGGQWQYGDDSAPEVGVTFFAGTFIRHPLTLAACKAVLDTLKAEGPALQQRLDEKTERFMEALNRLFTQAGLPVKVTRYSSLWMLNADPTLKHFSLLFYHLRLRGIHIWEGRGNFLSTAHTDEHCAAIVRAFAESVRALQEGGFFPGTNEHGELAESPLHEGGAGVPPAPQAANQSADLGHDRNAGDRRSTPYAGDQRTTAATLAGSQHHKPEGPTTLPLTPEQEELFLSTQLSADASVAAHESITLTLAGPLDLSRLKKALTALAMRHDALRVRFAPDGSCQTIEPSLEPELHIISAADVETARAEQFLTPFDLATAPLWRAALASHGPEEHTLLLTAHHLICDGWSFGVLAHDLARLYRGEALPPAPHLRDVVETPRDPDAAAYWQGEYAAPPAPAEWPTDRPRPLRADFSAATRHGAFAPETAAALKEWCRRERVTPNAVLLSVWQALLHRFSGGRDIIVGTPVAGQMASGFTDAVAHQVHFLPLRVQIGEGWTAADLLQAAKGKLADATDHQDYTLGQLYQALALPRQPGRPSFVTNTFTFENAGAPEDWGGGLTATLTPNPKRKLAFDASLFVIQDGGALRWQLVHQSALFHEETAGHWMRCFEKLLQGVLADAAAPLSALPLLDEHDEKKMLQQWNHAGHPAPPHASLHELFAEQARLTPQATALVFDDGSWTYAQLEAQAGSFARRLLAAGLSPTQRVALFAERSPHMIAAIFGILKAGGCYAPIDAAYPDSRIASLLEDLEPALIAGDPVLRARLENMPGRAPRPWIDLDAAAAETALSAQTPHVTVPSDHPAYIIYTSGSTGQPKGTVVPHRAAVRLVKGQGFASMTADETWLQLAPLSFDACTLELFAPLLNGGRLALMPPGTPSLADIGQAIKRHGVTSLWLTAGLFQLMVEERLEDLAPLRQLLTGGDVVSPAHARRVLERHPRLRLINGYGPTENTTFTCCHDITAADLERRSLPIGRPIAHTSVFIADEMGAPCPIGVPGELLTGGSGLALEYWKRPELTAEKFIEHPRFGRVYRTGDRACWRGDGAIEFLGRADNQIKVRGFRIEPGEIEAALLTHPSVKQAAIAARGGSAGEKRLTAWCVPHAGASIASEALRAHLRQKLPDYMIPQDFVSVANALPLTANGKIDFKALPEPSAGPEPAGAESSVQTPALVMPRNEAERRLHGLMQDALGRNHFGVTDDFFVLGGDSLRGLRLFTRIEKEFGRALPLGTLFTAPTVESLARELGGGWHELPRHIIPIQPQGTEPPLFLIHGGDGGVMFYRRAVAALSSNQPVFGIEAPMLTDSELLTPGDSVASVAAQYVALTRQVRPQGPYRLGGYSFGGIVAYEMARLLRETGETVEELLLFDTDNPAVPPRYFSAPERIRARWEIDKAKGLSTPQRAHNMALRFKWGLIERRKLRREADAVEAARLAGQRTSLELRPVEVREANMLLMGQYKPQPMKGDLTLFRCMGRNDKFEHTPALGWEGMAGGSLTIIPVTGTHLRLFDEPHVSLLAEKLAEHLASRQQLLPA